MKQNLNQPSSKKNITASPSMQQRRKVNGTLQSSSNASQPEQKDDKKEQNNSQQEKNIDINQKQEEKKKLGQKLGALLPQKQNLNQKNEEKVVDNKFDLKLNRVSPQVPQKVLDDDLNTDTMRKKMVIQKLFQGQKKLQSKTEQRYSQMHTGTLFVREFLDKMKKAQQSVKNSEETKVCTVKVDRVDRLRGVTIIYPKYIIPCKSRFKVGWEITVLLLIVYIAIFVPFQIGFHVKINVLTTIEYMIIAFFCIDILLSFRTTYFNQDGDEILEGKKILKNYVYSPNFMVDILSAVPIAEFFDDSDESIRLINLVKILRLLRLGRLLKLLQSDKVKYAALFFKSFMAFMMVLHWLTCFWFLISSADFQKATANFVITWIPSNLRAIAESSNTDEDQGIRDFYDEKVTPQGEIYIYSLYSMTMLILGGDIAPVNKKQSFTLSLCVIVGQTSLAILFANMSVLIFKVNQKTAEYVKQLENLQNTMETSNLNQELRSRVLEYFQYCWRKKKIFQPEISNFKDLSTTLERESLLIIHQEIVANVPLFSGLEMSELLSIIQKLKTHIFMPNECISRTNEISNEMYFISEGVVERITKIQEDEHQLEYDPNEAVSFYDLNGDQTVTRSRRNTQHRGSIIAPQGVQQLKRRSSFMEHQVEFPKNSDETPKQKLARKASLRMQKYGVQAVLEKERTKQKKKSTKQLDEMMHGSMLQLKEDQKNIKLLKKGDYFLELSLINSMRVEADFTASVFCITECFSRRDFEQLKREFPGIEMRLSKGMEIYKQQKKIEIAVYLQKCEVFEGFTLDELEYLYMDFLQDHYLETNEIVFHQGQSINKIHMIVKGRVNYSYQIIHDKEEEHREFLTIDDDIQYLNDHNVVQYDENLLLKTIMSLKKGAYFGFLNTENLHTSKIIAKNYYLTKEPTHVISMNQNIFEKLVQVEQFNLKEKLIENLKKIEQRQLQIQEQQPEIAQHNVFFMRVPIAHGDIVMESDDEKGAKTNQGSKVPNKGQVSKNLTKNINKMLLQQQQYLQQIQKKAKEFKSQQQQK